MDRIVPDTKVSSERCHNSSTSANASMATIAVTAPFAMNVNLAIDCRSSRSAIRPAIGETSRKGSMEANVTMPTSPDLSDLSRTSHEMATMKVHMAAPEHIFASQVNR